MNAKQWMMLALAALGGAIVPQAGQTAPAAAPERVVSDKEKPRPICGGIALHRARMGEITLPAGTHTLSLRLDHLQGEGPCNVGTLRLIPLPEEASKP